MTDTTVTMCVNPDIVIDGEHVASMRPRPHRFVPEIAYQHCDAWEQDEKYLAMYRTLFPELKHWTLEQFRGAKRQ